MIDGTEETGVAGTYEVFRDHVEIELIDIDGTYRARWSFDGTNLVLTEVTGECVGQTILSAHPWNLVEE